MQNLQELFIEKLKDIYDAEKRVSRALPKMAKAAASPELSSAFEEHLRQTQEHIRRLDRIFSNLDETPGRKTCHGMMGILEEGQETMGETAPDSVMDAALIAGAQEVEHYEIGGYGCLATWARLLGHDEEMRLFRQTLDEEEETDKKLTELASDINRKAMDAEQSEDEEQMVPVRRNAGNSRGGNGTRSNGRSRPNGGRSGGTRKHSGRR